MTIIDSHVHFWHPNILTYTWLDGLDALNKPYMPVHFRDATEGIDISGLVFVQADCLPQQGIDEVLWATSLDAGIEAIVAFAPLEQGDDVQPYLEELSAFPQVRGIRRLIQSEGPGFALQSSFVRGVQMLALWDLSFDICVLHHQISDVAELVSQCPDTRFVLNHGGKPDIRGRQFASWREHINTLADYENVSCKLSGLVTEADHATWHAADLRPVIDHLLMAFGPDRLMFGSDWPVMNLAATYRRWWSVLTDTIGTLSEDEQQAIFSKTAHWFYRIEQ